MTGRMTKWTPELDETLRQLWALRNQALIAEQMDLTADKVARRAKKLGLPKYKVKRRLQRNAPWRTVRHPSQEQWISVVKEHARDRRISAREVLCGNRHRPFVYTRWMAFKTILERFPNLSVLGVAKVSGFDHTAILHGLKRLQAMRAA